METNSFAPVTETPCPKCERPVHLAATEDARACPYCHAKVVKPSARDSGVARLPTTRPDRPDGGTS